MFTGIIQDIGTVARTERRGTNVLIGIRTGLGTDGFTIGESICIDGACQTLVGTEGDIFFVEASPETLSRTTLGSLAPGHQVNLERALLPTDRLGGHFVQGHVDDVGVLSRVDKSGRFTIISVQISADLLSYMVEKGSVAIDGVSLTVNEIQTDGFTVGLIPHTSANTTLDAKKAGDRVNVEADILAKYIERFLSLRTGEEPKELTKEALLKAGF